MNHDPNGYCCRNTADVIIGIDEVGRGCLAGPVFAAAVMFTTRDIPSGIEDSKKVSEKKRPDLVGRIRECAYVSVGQASVEEIDEINILQAALLAMKRAYDGLPRMSALVLVDGDTLPDLGVPAVAIINGDTLCPTIAAASNVAKQRQVENMFDLCHAAGGVYGWSRNKGYGTREHLDGISRHGISPHHRRSFAPIRRAIRARID